MKAYLRTDSETGNQSILIGFIGEYSPDCLSDIREVNVLCKTWYHVSVPEKEGYGFSANESGIIVDHPHYAFKGMSLQDIKPHLLSVKARVSKVAVQYLKIMQ